MCGLGRGGLLVMLVVALVWPDALAQQAPGAQTKRPNIVLIMADDMGFSDLGCYGGEIPTPHLDSLAAGGMRMTQFYNTARCCPTRASLLTGLYAHQAGVGHMVGDRGTPAYRGFLNERCATIGEVLRPAGYHTLMVGKWHVGQRRPHWPVNRGFERYWGLVDGGSNYFKIEANRTLVDQDRKIDPDDAGFYLTDAFSDKAVGFVQEYGGRGDKPFFLYLAYTAPHWPLHAPKAAIEKHRGKYLKGWDTLREERHRRQVEMGIVDAKWKVAERDAKAKAWDQLTREEKELADLKMAVYAAQVEVMDAGIGRVMAAIREMGLERDTLVMFLADNGGCAEEVNRSEVKGAPPGGRESFLSYGLPWANASNTPFRMFKHWVHEGGISSPLIAYWPGVIGAGRIEKGAVGHVIDLAPTCYEVAGAAYPKELGGRVLTPIEGKSLMPVFKTGKREGHGAIYWEHENHKAVRVGGWKLVTKARGKWELYNLAEDRTEMNDLAEKEAGRVAEMQGLWQAWAKRNGVLEKGTAPRQAQAR